MVGTAGPAAKPFVTIINGRTDEGIDPFDRGFHYGDGLFETLAVRDGRPCLWQQHLDRLIDSCRRIGIVPPASGQLHDEALRLTTGRPEAVLKIIVSRGPGARGYAPGKSTSPTRWLACLPRPAHLADWQSHGVKLARCQTRLGANPQLAGIKHLSRLEQVLAAAELVGFGADEGVMCDTDGHVVEGTCTNLYASIDDRLVTPPVDTCGVDGVVRQLVLRTGGALGQPIEVTTLDVDDLLRADRLFLSNSLAGVVEVARLDARRYPLGKPLPDPLAEAQAKVFDP